MFTRAYPSNYSYWIIDQGRPTIALLDLTRGRHSQIDPVTNVLV